MSFLLGCFQVFSLFMTGLPQPNQLFACLCAVWSLFEIVFCDHLAFFQEKLTWGTILFISISKNDLLFPETVWSH